jgi:hypothetical protein
VRAAEFEPSSIVIGVDFYVYVTLMLGQKKEGKKRGKRMEIRID